MEPKNLFENNEMEPSFLFEQLDKCSFNDLFDFQHDINRPVLYPSFNFHEDNEEDIYGCIKPNNLINDAPNNATLTNTVATPINIAISKDKTSKDGVEPENSNIVQDKSENFNIVSRDNQMSVLDEEDKSNAMSDSDSDNEMSEDDDYVEGLNEKKKSKRSSKKIYAQNKKIHHVKVKRQEGVILKRWDRRSDRDVFQFIKNQLKPTGMDIQEFIFDYTIKISDEKKRIILCKMRLKILEQAIKVTGWLNTPYFLFKRLRRFASIQSFSFREMKQLRKILKAQSACDKFDLPYIEYYFPGKSSSTIIEATKKILNTDVNPF